MSSGRGKQVVVLGAGYAGLSCAFHLAAQRPEAAITVVDARATFCERIRLHQAAAGQTLRKPALAAWLARAGVRFEQARAIGLDSAARRVLTDQGRLRYDHLVVALGSDTSSDVPGVTEFAHSISSEAGASRLAAEIRELPAGSRAVIVGAGLTGIELAAELAERRPDLEVLLWCRTALGQDMLSASGAHKLRGALSRLGVRVQEGVQVFAVTQGRAQGSLGDMAFDVCVWTAGFSASNWVQNSGLPTTSAGRLAVDAKLRVLDSPEIYGVGDVAEPAVKLGAPALMSCRLGMPAGRHAAENLARELSGEPLEAWRVRDVLRCISLGRHDGLIQFHHSDGQLRELCVSGRAAAWLKEKICQGTLWALERGCSRAARVRGLQKLPSSPMAHAS